MASGTLIMTAFGSLFNAVYLLPTFAKLYGIPLDAIIAMGTSVNANITSVSTRYFMLLCLLIFLKELSSRYLPSSYITDGKAPAYKINKQRS